LVSDRFTVTILACDDNRKPRGSHVDRASDANSGRVAQDRQLALGHSDREAGINAIDSTAKSLKIHDGATPKAAR
jgi:hypothetical protein